MRLTRLFHNSCSVVECFKLIYLGGLCFVVAGL
jgi:hypothetical protein